MPAPQESSSTDLLYERIQSQIQQAEQEAAARNQQLALYYYSQDGESILVTKVGYHNTGLLVLDGLDSVKRECRVLVHVASLALTMKFLSAKSATQTRKIEFSG